MKWIDERRGCWMYSHRDPVRERWFGPRELKRRLLAGGFRRSASNICCRAAEAGPASVPVGARHAAVGALGGAGAGRSLRDRTLFAARSRSLPLLLWKTPPGLELILAQEGVPFETVKDAHPFVVPGGPVCPVRRPAVPPGSTRSRSSGRITS